MDQAKELWKRIEERISSFNESTLKPYRVSLSHGLAEYKPDSDISTEELISIADKEMYKKKKRQG